MTPQYTTLLFNGTDLRTQTGVSVIGFLDVFAPGTIRGKDEPIAGARGQVGATTLPLDEYTFTNTFQVKGDTIADMWANLSAFTASLTVGTISPMERRIAIDDTGGFTSWTASGRCTGAQVNIPNAAIARVQVQIVNLDGAWTPDGGTTWVL